MTKIEAIHEDDAYKQLKLIRKECEQYVEDVELLVEGLKNTVTAEAEKRLAGVQTAISSTFTNLTNRADFPGLKVSAVGDGYAIELVNASGTTRSARISFPKAGPGRTTDCAMRWISRMVFT